LKLKALILLTLALLAFSTPVLVTLNVSAPKLHGTSRGIINNIESSVHPCGDPVDDPELPH
jgi:hypothetical protein